MSIGIVGLRYDGSSCKDQDHFWLGGRQMQPQDKQRARDFDRQVVELQVRFAILNGFTALGSPVTKIAE